MGRPTIVSPEELAARTDLTDWRYLLGRLETTYRCGSLHHPDLDVRYPDVVHVALTTHAADSQTTELDVSLALTVSGLAAAAGARCDPVVAQGYELAIDALDIDAVAPFWEALLGYRRLQRSPDGVRNLVDPLRIGPAVWFQQMDEPRAERNRLHVDVTVAADTAEERVAAAVAAGGRVVTAEYARSWWVLAGPEGNEACVCTWQDRG
jgi:4a-hydroxytetrahydrobiopterin dehydratase